MRGELAFRGAPFLLPLDRVRVIGGKNMDETRYIRVKYTNVSEIKSYIDQNCPGTDTAPRAIENALRRGKLKFYQIGQKRYTTHELIDEWLASLVTTAGPKAVGE
jgi:hypothetical protein